MAVVIPPQRPRTNPTGEAAQGRPMRPFVLPKMNVDSTPTGGAPIAVTTIASDTTQTPTPASSSLVRISVPINYLPEEERKNPRPPWESEGEAKAALTLIHPELNPAVRLQEILSAFHQSSSPSLSNGEGLGVEGGRTSLEESPVLSRLLRQTAAGRVRIETEQLWARGPYPGLEKEAQRLVCNGTLHMIEFDEQWEREKLEEWTDNSLNQLAHSCWRYVQQQEIIRMETSLRSELGDIDEAQGRLKLLDDAVQLWYDDFLPHDEATCRALIVEEWDEQESTAALVHQWSKTRPRLQLWEADAWAELQTNLVLKKEQVVVICSEIERRRWIDEDWQAVFEALLLAYSVELRHMSLAVPSRVTCREIFDEAARRIQRGMKLLLAKRKTARRVKEARWKESEESLQQLVGSYGLALV